jgi:hypothetical protein
VSYKHVKRKLIITSSILAGTAVMLTAVYAVQLIAARVEAMQMPLLRAAAQFVTLVLGVLLLVGATYFSTHLVVRLCGKEAPPPGV